ncbi:MAG: hypothetical protein WBK91_08130 [Alphaproteobacteria bacterium]
MRRIYPHDAQGAIAASFAVVPETIPGFIDMKIQILAGSSVDESRREFYPRFTPDQLPSTESN